MSSKISIGMRVRTRLECHTLPCTQIGHCGDGVPRVFFLEECGLACYLGQPLRGRGLSSCLRLRVAKRSVRSRKGSIRWRVALVGQCPCLVGQRVRRRRRTEYLRDKLGRSQTRQRVQVYLCVPLVGGSSHEPFFICRPGEGSYNNTLPE